ncbi:hypothetical protein L1279_001166 [Planomicrobium sp. HSC-17F08]|nr:hypothetical protein [Planomicrobium sp. HSC-17F08]
MDNLLVHISISAMVVIISGTDMMLLLKNILRYGSKARRDAGRVWRQDCD